MNGMALLDFLQTRHIYDKKCLYKNGNGRRSKEFLHLFLKRESYDAGLFDNPLLFDGESISRMDLYVNEILTTKCGVRCR